MLRETALSALAMALVLGCTYFLLAHFSGHMSVPGSLFLGLCAFGGGLVGGFLVFAVRRPRGR